MFIPSDTAASTEGSTLILPSVSIGNVPQLAVDLLINTLRATRIGIIHTPSLMPISAPSGFDHLDHRSVPLEVYQTADRKWTIIQQRSPPLARHHRQFAQEIMQFIQASEFDKVVLLTSSDAALRVDEMIDGPQIRALTVNWEDQALASRLLSLALSPLCAGRTAGISPGLDQLPLKHLHASGVAKPLLKLCQESKVPVVALVALVFEGDNVPDAINMANATNALLELVPFTEQWVPPRSWQWLMAPTSAPTELF
ncbi:hypothetical protein IWW55_002382 [Coemansia sp. RSA 2706]|nr:hypothetical protein IWW55_002382 [Coemansia sp. RSA 2706]KAJ2313603.1 hypothetical protein IWW52_004516 [Coemansia sp. RSA 2704]KAJ2313902.1 hypothetical protein IWW54_001235 [Coemansia sp. RSA 2705]KAJ2367964.1 hypothetical protein H4S01_001858 [Coemansia sp. RSA 2610]KAJ2709508.1 hypothetical protein H4R23_006786 [Coemansia sp. Cherry 401B]